MQFAGEHDAGGQLFHGFVGGAGVGDAVLAEHGFGLVHFAPAVFRAGVLGVGAALGADMVQTGGVDGETEDFGFEGFNHARQVGAVQIVGGKRVVGGADAVLQGEVEAGGGFAAAGYAHEDHVGIGEIFGGHAVVVVEGEVYGFHAGVVALGVLDAVGAPHLQHGLSAELFFQFVDEGIKKAQVQAVTVADDVADIFANDTGEDNGAQVAAVGNFIHFGHHAFGFLGGVDKGIGEAFEFDVVELVEQGVAHAFGGEAGAVGNKDGVACAGRHDYSFQVALMG